MKLTKGEELTPSQRREVLRAFIYRATVDNKRFVHGLLQTHATQTDAEWIDAHAFWITKAGRLARNIRYAKPV